MGRQKKGEREERWKYREERVYIYHLSLHLPPIPHLSPSFLPAQAPFLKMVAIKIIGKDT